MPRASEDDSVPVNLLLETRKARLMPRKVSIPSSRPRTRALAGVLTRGQPGSVSPQVDSSNDLKEKTAPVRRANPKRKARPPQYDTPKEAVSSHPTAPVIKAQPPKAKSQKAKKALPASEQKKPLPKPKRSQKPGRHTEAGQPIKSTQEPRKRQALPKPKPAPRQREPSKSKPAKPSPLQVPTRRESRVRTNSNKKTGLPIEEPQQRATPPDSNIRPWLESVRSVSPDRVQRDQARYTAPVPGISAQFQKEMDSSSASRENNENNSTVRVGKRYPTKVSYQKLRFRCVEQFASKDPKLVRLRKSLQAIDAEEPIRNIEELHAFTKDFANTSPDDVDEHEYSFIDRFSLHLDQRKSQCHYPIINPAYFAAMLEKCLSKNEAVLQRTIMMSIFHHYWLGEKFDWNTEGQWSQPKDTRLPSREDDDITLPKPDLAISFTLSSLTRYENDSDPFPLEIERCLSPDGGGDDGRRCFPFLFMEVKKAAADLKDAYIANLHNASQALYNMYQWMVRAEMESEFFAKVRVFSFVFNAQDLQVRIHRAEKGEDGSLTFRFAEFIKSMRYDRDLACNLFNSILKNYAETELHSTVQRAFRKVSELEEQRVASKRKAGAVRDENNKRSRSSQNSTPHTGQSFNMSQLQT